MAPRDWETLDDRLAELYQTMATARAGSGLTRLVGTPYRVEAAVTHLTRRRLRRAEAHGEGGGDKQ